MNPSDWLADLFEKNRAHLRRVASRILGSQGEADDALQEAWLRVSRAGAGDVQNLGGWLTTIVARVCLDMLRTRSARREAGEAEVARTAPPPEADLMLADSLGPALLVVLETLTPPERVAFVLHDLFEVTFEEIAPIVGRSPAAARQLASRARRRVRGEPPVPEAELARHREIVSAFLTASRDGNFEALLAVLDPDVVLRSDAAAIQAAAQNHWGGRPDLPAEARGPRAVAEALHRRAGGVRPALIDGSAGAAAGPATRVLGAWLFIIEAGKILEIDLRLDPPFVAQLRVQLDDRN